MDVNSALQEDTTPSRCVHSCGSCTPALRAAGAVVHPPRLQWGGSWLLRGADRVVSRGGYPNLYLMLLEC